MLYRCGFTGTGTAYDGNVAVSPRRSTFPKVKQDKTAAAVLSEVKSLAIIEAAGRKRETSYKCTHREVP